MSTSKLMNGVKTAEALGIDQSQLSRLMKSGAITAEIHEGRLIRFDVEKVRKQLAKRARDRAAREAALPDGMVPTY